VRTEESSPFVFGGADPIDPRVLQGLDATYQPGDQTTAERPRQQNDEDLGGLY
jgi:hypothetical protein